HGQYVDNIAMARATTYYDPSFFDHYNPTTFVNQIDVPVFLASAFQDEQTGPYFFTLLDRFTSSPATRLTVYNGVHIDAFQPAVLTEWIDFLELFVANRSGFDNHNQRAVAPMIFSQVFQGTSDLDLPPSRFADIHDVNAAKAQWMSEPKVRVLFELGAGNTHAGEPVPTFEHSFTSFPPDGQVPTRMYAQPTGTLVTIAPATAGDQSFTLDPDNGTRGILAPGGDVWDSLPAYNWPQHPAGKAVVFESAPLTAAAVNFGTASADLWVRSSVDDADLQVTITEVRPDGKEMYVQSGTQRASLAKSSASATELWPAPSETQADSAKLVPGEWKQIRVGVPIFAHVFRIGSKIRISVDTPGATRATWTYKLLTFATGATIDIGSSATHPSSFDLPFVSGVTAPTTLPPCPSLRGQPCHAYQAYTNTPAAN
ncbi:MAG TPA: CocE/NonD family hydrolase C-terminal non-catalytic domain-containing protein, partial [Kofleriaceae bacterium]